MIAAFCELLARIDGKITEQACRAWLGEAFDSFRAAGLLPAAQPADSVLCEACFQQHCVSVEWDEDDGRMVARCPIGGVFPVGDAAVAMVTVDVPKCLGALQSALIGRECPTRELVPGKAWHLGVGETCDIDWNALLVPGALTGRELAILAQEIVKLPQCMLDVALTGNREIWPDVRLPRTLHALALPEALDWTGHGVTIRHAMLDRWLTSFFAGRAAPLARSGRPPSKTAWLYNNWRAHEAELQALKTDTDRTRFLNTAYTRDSGGDTMTRGTVVKLLDQVMPNRVKNCQ